MRSSMTRHQNYGPKTTPLEHQIEAIDFISNSPEVALFDEQGLGKTKMIVDAMARAMESGDIEGVLVVAPMSLVYVWESEVLKHSFLTPVVLRGSKTEKRYQFLTGANFYITNYEAVVSEQSRFERFCRSRSVALVLDESARIKNPETKTAQALYVLAPLAARRIILTGTPVANKPEDLWGQFYFLDGGRLLGTNFKAFKARMNERSPHYRDELNKLRTEIGENSLRRRKNDALELPEKVYVSDYVTLEGGQNEMYRRCAEELIVEIKSLDGRDLIDQIENVLKKLLRLTQIASNPLLLDQTFTGSSAKLDRLSDLVPLVLRESEKLVVWTCFVESISLLKSHLGEYFPLVIYGGVSIEERSRIVSKFQEKDRSRILIANPAAAREGLTLTRASAAIYFDRNFSLMDYLQSQDRIHRIGQEHKCTIYKQIARNTIDEYTDMLIEIKAEIARFLQADQPDLVPTVLDDLLNKQTLLRAIGG
jgi:SWI/SNF-related matrix-associated actin-dependent regulator 1 of chromatin subfamily A